MGAAWVLLAVMAMVSLLGAPFGRDHQIFALVADAILSGGRPYVDVWDYKTPGIYAVFTVGRALTGGAFGVRLVEVAALASLFPAFGIASRHYIGDPRPGWLGAVLSISTYASFGFWHTAQPEAFAGVAMAWALVFAASEPRMSTGMGIGVACGVAAVFKPTCALPLAVLAWSLVDRPKRSLDAVIGVVSGFSLVVMATLVVVALMGALPAMGEAVRGFAAEHVRQVYLVDGPVQHLVRASKGFLGVATFALLCSVPLLTLRPVHALERRGTALALGMVVASLIGAAVQGRYFMYHFAEATLLAGLPAAWGIWKVRLAAPEARQGWVTGIALVAFILFTPRLVGALTNPVTELDGDRVAGVKLATFKQSLIDQTARSLQGVPLGAIYVWGMEPGLYLATGRRAASRYVTNEPQRTWWSAEEARTELMRELSDDPPVAILVQRGDTIPFLMGSSLDSQDTLQEFADLAGLLETRYERREEAPSSPDGSAASEVEATWDVYLRRNASAPTNKTPSKAGQPSSRGGR